MRWLSCTSPNPGRKQKPSKFSHRASCGALNFRPKVETSDNARSNGIGHDSFLRPMPASRSLTSDSWALGSPGRLNAARIASFAARSEFSEISGEADATPACGVDLTFE